MQDLEKRLRILLEGPVGMMEVLEAQPHRNTVQVLAHPDYRYQRGRYDAFMDCLILVRQLHKEEKV